MMPTKVGCMVTSCVYQSNGTCTAQEIAISDNSYGSAHVSDDTICQTFKPKSK